MTSPGNHAAQHCANCITGIDTLSVPIFVNFNKLMWIDEHDLTTSLYADIIQMMHGSEWTLKYDEPEIENVALELHPRATFSTSGSSYFNVHSLPCFICFVVWPTNSLKLYIVF